MADSEYCLLGKYGQVSETQWWLGPGLGHRHLINVHGVYTAEQLKLRAYFPLYYHRQHPCCREACW